MTRRAAVWQFRAMTKATNSIIQPIGTDTDMPPEWVHLIPSGTFTGVDGRGPYMLSSAAAVIAASMPTGRKLPIDINHAIDIVSDQGKPTPAQAWIVALEARDDGLWGRVEWTPEGIWAMASKAYGFLSPVFAHTKEAPFQVLKLLRAALTNNPNLTLTALHNREDKAMLEHLRKLLGLPETADEAAVMAAATALHTAQTAHAATMARVAEAAGVAANTTGDALVTAIQSAKTTPAGDQAAEIAQLKGQVTALHNQLTGYVQVTSLDKATHTIDQAIKDGKVIPALRDHYIARHVKDSAEVEKEIAACRRPGRQAAAEDRRRHGCR